MILKVLHLGLKNEPHPCLAADLVAAAVAAGLAAASTAVALAGGETIDLAAATAGVVAQPMQQQIAC